MVFQKEIILFLPSPPQKTLNYVKILVPEKEHDIEIKEIKFIGNNEIINPDGYKTIKFLLGVDRQIIQDIELIPFEEIVAYETDIKIQEEFGLYYYVDSDESFYRSDAGLNQFCYYPYRMIISGRIIQKIRAR